MKTVQRKEAEFLQKLLPGYYLVIIYVHMDTYGYIRTYRPSVFIMKVLTCDVITLNCKFTLHCDVIIRQLRTMDGENLQSFHDSTANKIQLIDCI